MPVSCGTSDAPALVRYSFDGDWVAREINDRRLELIKAGHLTAASAVLFDLRRTTMFPDLADLHRHYRRMRFGRRAARSS